MQISIDAAWYLDQFIEKIEDGSCLLGSLFELLNFWIILSVSEFSDFSC